MPSSSPDSLIYVLGVGLAGDIGTQAVDPMLSPNPVGIGNYPEFTVPSIAEGIRQVITISPRLSPDGTRLAVRARPPGGPTELPQIWAARRNMNLPPTLATISNRVFQEGRAGQFTISASDPENDPIIYSAFYLQLGMTFVPSTRTFSWTPPGGTRGHNYNIKFLAATSSGGTSSQVVRIAVIPPIGGPSEASAGTAVTAGGENPSRGPFTVLAPALMNKPAELQVFDLAGRLVARVKGNPGTCLTWDTRTLTGSWAAPGIYYFRLSAQGSRRTGKWILLR
jgi:hypothetical protein